MGIPIGTQYTTTVSGSVVKEVTCENCSTEYVYQVERKASASGSSVLWLDNQGAKDRSSSAAHASLQKELDKAIEVVPCPACGWIQADMGRQLKNRRLGCTLGLSYVVAVGLFIARFIAYASRWEKGLWLFIAAGVVAALGTIVAIAWKILHNPNAGHPGAGGKDEAKAQASTGQLKSEFEAQHAAEREEFIKAFHLHLLQVMIQVGMIDGPIDEEETEAMQVIYQQVAEEELTAQMVVANRPETGATPDDLLRDLSEFQDKMSDEGKALFIKAGIAVGACGEGVGEPEWNFIIALAQTMLIPPEQFQLIVEEMKSDD